MKRCLRCKETFRSVSWTCPSCGYEPEANGQVLVFTRTRDDRAFPDESFAQLVDREASNYWFRARNRLIIWALKRHFPAARNLLEIGCGTGYVLSGIRAACPEIELTGSEVSGQGLAYAATRLPGVTILQLDARQLPFSGEFDVVCGFDMLEHIMEDEDVLCEMFRSVRPGGGVALTVPQHPSLWSAVDEYSGHVRRYTRADLAGKVTRAGFCVVFSSSFVSLLLPALYLQRSRSRRTPADAVDPNREFDIPRSLNAMLELVLGLELTLIRLGMRFAAGGSLLLIAVKPKQADAA